MDEKKVQQAIKLLKAAAKKAEQNNDTLEIAYSGGKDSDCLLELAKEAGIKYKAVYKCTTIDPAGTIKHAKEKGAEILMPKENFATLIQKNGLPHRRRRFCCSILKEYKYGDYVAMGVRKAESKARDERYKEPTECRIYNKKKNIRSSIVYPLLYWTDDDISDFVTSREIKCHPLYYTNGTFDVKKRLGCMCCPMQNRKARLTEFKNNPKMVKFYLRNLDKFFATHDIKANNKARNAYEQFYRDVFCKSSVDFTNKIQNEFTGERYDCKLFLENYFNVKL